MISMSLPSTAGVADPWLLAAGLGGLVRGAGGVGLGGHGTGAGRVAGGVVPWGPRTAVF
jgi:hypothetical protein